MLYLILAGILLASTQPPMQKVDVFPATDTVTGREPLDFFRREWYSRHLVALGESVLPEGPGETFRFLWLRSFDHPIVIRVACVEKACELTARRADGQGGYAPGSVVEEKTRRLSEREVARFQDLRARLEFWRPQPAEDRIGLDGARWVLEGRRARQYHVWDVWSPDGSGSFAAFREFCEHLVRASGLAVQDEMD